MSYSEPDLDLSLAFDVLDQVNAHPEQHVQTSWRCDTGQCYAGWVGVMTGAKWVSDNPNSNDYERVHVPEEYQHLFGVNAVPVEYYATKVLGLNEYQTALFNGSNSRPELEAMLSHLKDHPQCKALDNIRDRFRSPSDPYYAGTEHSCEARW